MISHDCEVMHSLRISMIWNVLYILRSSRENTDSCCTLIQKLITSVPANSTVPPPRFTTWLGTKTAFADEKE